MGSSKKSPNTEQMQQLEALIQQDPSSPRFAELADVYTRLGRFSEAIQLCQRGLAYHRKDANGYLSLGRALFGTGRLAVATEALERAVRFAPTETEAYRLLGEVLVRRGLVDEAVQVLEEAVQRGGGDQHIERLLERANAALDREETRVTGAPKGMGNQAIAGTIGGTQQTDLRATGGEQGSPADSYEEILQGIQPPSAASGLALEAFPDVRGEGTVKPASKEWRAVGDQWQESIDAQAGERLLTDPDVPVGRPVEFDPAPLSDPAAAGMPPLPDETQEVFLPAEDEQVQQALEEGPSEVSELETADTLEIGSPPEAVFELPAMASWAKHDFHQLEAAAKSTAERAAISERQFEESLLRDLAQEPPRQHGERTAERRIGIPSSYSEQSGVYRSRGRSIVRALLWLVLLVSVAAGGFVAWRHVQRKKVRAATSEVLSQALAAGTPAALREAQRRIGELGAISAIERKAARRLLAALGALWYKEPLPKASTTAQGNGWYARAARAAELLASNEPAKVPGELGAAPPQQEATRWLHALLSAHAYSSEGRYKRSLEALEDALSRAPKALPARLLRARLWLLLGWYERAEDDFRALEAADAKARWARVGLAAALLRRGLNPKGEARALRSKGDGEAIRLAALVSAEQARDPGAALVASSEGESLSSVLLLSYATRALAGACRFRKAERTLEKLRIGWPAVGALVAQLEGEIALARGDDQGAVSLFGTKVVSPAHLRLRAWAELLLGRPKRAASLLEGDRADAARPLHLAAGALRLAEDPAAQKSGRRPATGALEELAKRSFVARVGLAMVLEKMGQRGQARAVLEKTSVRPLAESARALTMAASYGAAEDPGAAWKTLLSVRRSCAQYAPASALAGALALDAADLSDAIRLFSAARQFGLETPELKVATARAELALGRPQSAEAIAKSTGAAPDAALGLLRAELAAHRMQWKRAEALLRKLPPSAPTVLLQARVARHTSGPGAALRLLGEGSRRYPHSLALKAELGASLVGAKRAVQQRKGEALLLQCAREANSLSLGHSAAARSALVLARRARLRRNKREALALIERAEQLDADSVEPLRLRAEVLLDSRKVAAAVRVLKRAVARRDRDVPLQLLLGRACQLSRDVACARDALRAVVRITPGSAVGKRAARQLARLR